MNELVRKFTASMDRNPPATETAIRNTELEIGMTFPAEYREFMLESNGSDGSVGENSYLAIWSIEEIVPLNKDLHVEEYTPGLVFFASDGGGTAYAFDKRLKNVTIVEIPDDSIHIEDAKPCGNTFQAFLENLYNAE